MTLPRTPAFTMRIPTLLSLLLALAVTAQEKPSQNDEKKSETTSLEVLEIQGKRLALVRLIASAADFQAFQKEVEAISKERQETAQTKQLLDLALTSPEKEARQRQLDARLQKLTLSNQAMNKAYGFDLTRQYLVVPTKLAVYKVLTDDEYIKVAAAANFDKASISEANGRKLQVRGTITGAVEVETFQIQVRGVVEAKQRLLQLVDLQPKLTKEEDKRKVADAIKRLQEEVNEAEAAFAKKHGYPFSDTLATQVAEAKLYVLLSDEENKAIDKAASDAKDGKKPEASK
jgi:hypothetical protein